MSQPALLDNLITRHGYPLLDLAGAEVMRHFSGRCRAALVTPEAEAALQRRFGFRVWPALVFLRGGAYLSAIARVRNWGEYLSEFERLLCAKPAPVPKSSFSQAVPPLQ